MDPRESSGWLAVTCSLETVHLSRAKILKTKQELLVGEQLLEATVHINNRFTASSHTYVPNMSCSVQGLTRFCTSDVKI